MLRKCLAVISVVCASMAASAAWYDNPSILKLVPLATKSSATEDPHFMNKSADDKTLLVNLQARDDNDGSLLVDMAELADPDNDSPTLRKVFAKPSAIGGIHYKGGAISSDLGLALLGNGISSASCSFLTGEGTAWTKGVNLFNRTLDCKTDGLDFGTGSTYLYANVYPGGDLARYTVGAQGVLSDKVVKATGVARVRNVSVYNVAGKELVYYGNGADNTTDGKVCVMDVTDANVANWTETELAQTNVAISVPGVVTNVKLSNEDSGEPILYALTDNGYLGIYKLAADGKSVVETIKTLEPATLKDLAGQKGATAKFRNFEVTKDGQTAFLINRVDEHNVYLAVLSNVPYIEMKQTDKLAIDTGYTPGPDTAIWADYAFMGNFPTGDQYFVYEAGAVNSNGNAYFRPYINGNSGSTPGTRAYAWALNASGWQSTGTVVTPGERHQLLLDSANNKVSFWSGSTVKNVTPGGTPPTKRASTTLKLFSASGMGSNFADMRVYGIKVYEKGELIRNYVPAKKGDVVGLYDKVEGIFYTSNKGTGGFACAGDVLQLPADSNDEANNYIESNGSVAYSTDYYANPNTSWKVDYQFASTNTAVWGRIVCGAYDANNCDFSTILYVSGSGWLNSCFRDGAYSGSTFDTRADTERRQVLTDGPCMKATMYKKGVFQKSISVVNGTCTKTAKWPFMVFGDAANAYASPNQAAKVRIFSLQLWESGKLVRDYRPLVLDGKPGLLDNVTGHFICGPGLTAGSGVPTASGIGEGCIEADGTASVNTDFWPTDKSRLEVEYAFNDTSVKQKRVYGNDGYENARRCSVYINGSGYLAYGYGDDTWNGGATVNGAVNCDRHTVIEDFKGFKFWLMTGSVTNSLVKDIPPADLKNFVKTANSPISLFGGSNQAKGWTANNLSKMRIYRARFYENDVLVRDLVPAKRDGKAGFKDLVTGRFHGANKGSGLTAIGSVVEMEVPAKPSDNCYIQGGGGNYNYITLPHFPSGATRYECDFRLTKANSGKVLFGSYDCGFSQILYLPSGQFQFDCGDGKHGDANQSAKPAQDTLRHTVFIDATTGDYALLSEDGSVVTNGVSTKTRSATATNPTVLFGTSHSNTSGGNGAQCALAKIYGFRIFEAGVLVHDYVPRKVDGIYGFRDLATGEFVTGEGLTGGSDVPEEKGDAYLDTMNRLNHSIDTGIIATSNTCVVADFAYMVHENNPQQFLFEGGSELIMRTYTSGSQNTDAAMAWACANAGSSDMYLNDSTHVQVGVRRQVKIDAFNKRVTISTGSQGGYTNTNKSLTKPMTAKNTKTLKIFGNVEGTDTRSAQARLYGFKIYEAGELVRDYRPRLIDGEAVLFDTVTQTAASPVSAALPLASGGAFAKEDDVSTDETATYVDTDGSHPLVLGYYMKPTSKLVCDFASRKPTASSMLISPWDDGCVMASALWINTVTKFRFITGSGRTAGTEGSLAKGCRHTAVIDALNQVNELFEGGTNSVLRHVNAPAFSNEVAAWPVTLGGSVNNAAGTTFVEKFSTPVRVYGVKIYEDETLVHDFIPYVNTDGVAGLLDVKGNLGFRTAEGLVAGSKPLAENVTVYVERPGDCKLSYARSGALVANVVNATGYRWTMNGVELSGMTSGTLPIVWQKHKGDDRTDTYTVTPIFLVDGEEVDGESATAVVTSDPSGLTILIR